MNWKILMLMALLASAQVFAADRQGTVKTVSAYSSFYSDVGSQPIVVFDLDSAPGVYFYINKSEVTLVSVLLTAKASGNTVVVTYDNTHIYTYQPAQSIMLQ